MTDIEPAQAAPAVTPASPPPSSNSGQPAFSPRLFGLIGLIAGPLGPLRGLGSLGLGTGLGGIQTRLPDGIPAPQLPAMTEPEFASPTIGDTEVPAEVAARNAADAVSACGQVDLRQGAVFTLSNRQPENEVLAFGRASDGTLCAAGTYPTGGASDFVGIQASGQNAVIAKDGFVFAISSGSRERPVGSGPGSVSVFRIEPDRLVLVDVEPSGGPNPRSVTRYQDAVYVVNAGTSVGLIGTGVTPMTESVQGFSFDEETGDLTVLDGSHILTIDPQGHPAQIEFTPDGRHLVVSQRSRHAATFGHPQFFVEVLNLDERRLPLNIVRYEVGGDRPFGFRIDENNVVFLTHGVNVDSDPSGISSHRVNPDGSLTTLTPFTADGAGETCWNYLSQTTQVPYMYTSAFFDSAIGQALIDPAGSMALVTPRLASSAASGGHRIPADAGGLDMAGTVDASGAEYLYVLNNPFVPAIGRPVARIVGFRINPDGGLTRLEGSFPQGLLNTGFGLWAL